MGKLNNKILFLGSVFALALGMIAYSLQGAQAAATIPYPVVKLRSLDKVTARTMTFEAKVGSTVQFGPLYIKVQACRKSPPIENPESAAFLQIWEMDQKDVAQWVFSGWMFASSPALSPMDHPIYDVWVIDCLRDQAPGKEKDELSADSVPQQPAGAAEAMPEQASQNEIDMMDSGTSEVIPATPDTAPDQREDEIEAEPLD